MITEKIAELEQKIQGIRAQRDELKAQAKAYHETLDRLLIKARAIRAVGEEGLQLLMAEGIESGEAVGGLRQAQGE